MTEDTAERAGNAGEAGTTGPAAAGDSDDEQAAAGAAGQAGTTGPAAGDSDDEQARPRGAATVTTGLAAPGDGDDDQAKPAAAAGATGHAANGQATGPRRPPRLVDIAAAVGVHVSTVSRVLNDRAGHAVRPETTERILAEAKALGYRPNALARALRRQRTGALAFVVPMLRNPIWIRLQAGALARAGERGYVMLVIEEPTEQARRPADYTYLVEESRADGLLLATALRAPGGDRQPELAAIPHVYVNRRGPARGNDVVMDEDGAAKLFVEHVASLGHRSILLLDGPAEVDTVHRRATATREYCRVLGLQACVRHADATEEGGWTAIRELTAAGPVPTAIGVGSLNQLFGVAAALRAAQIAVPREVSLVSFDEDECLAYLDVPVTSVCMPLAELGTAAVDALIARIEGTADCDDVLVREPMFLTPRASVAPPP